MKKPGLITVQFAHRNEHVTIIRHAATIILAIGVFVLFMSYQGLTEEKSHLSEGIKLYNNKLYNEALYEFSAEIKINQHCPLAYYYAAHIRITKEQYRRAKINLEAALRDSTDYHDAHGLLAVTFLKMGEKNQAIAEWKTFVQAVGIIEDKSLTTAESIMIPEEYHRLFQIEAERKEHERLEAEKREHEPLLIDEKKDNGITADTGEIPAPESIPESSQSYSTMPRADDTTTDIEQPLNDLEKRIKSNIRFGIYGIILATIFLFICLLGTFYWIRKRRARMEETNFSEQVDRLLNDREFELDEEKALREFEAKRREIVQEGQPQIDAYNQRDTVIENVVEVTKQPPQETIIHDNMKKSLITEEIKALVSRLHREGHSAEDIAQTADLTKTEVHLILAVREHQMDNLIDEINREGDDLIDRDQLLHAINDLSMEGANNREIAKTLNISISEVSLATSINEMQKKNSND